MVSERSCTNRCQEKGYCTWIATKMSYIYRIFIFVTANTCWTSRLSARHFFIFLHGPQYVPVKQDSCGTTIGRIHFLTVIQRSWDETWNCDVQEMKSLWVPPHRHSNTQLPQQLVMTSDWWWQWRRFSRKDAPGHWISRWFAACHFTSTACSLLPRFCILICALA